MGESTTLVEVGNEWGQGPCKLRGTGMNYDATKCMPSRFTTKGSSPPFGPCSGY